MAALLAGERGTPGSWTIVPAQGSVLTEVCGTHGKWRGSCIPLAIGCAKHWAPGKALGYSMRIQQPHEFHSKESQKIYFVPKGWCFQLIFLLSPYSQGLYYTPETSLLGTISDNGTFFKYHHFFLHPSYIPPSSAIASTDLLRRKKLCAFALSEQSLFSWAVLVTNSDPPLFQETITFIINKSPPANFPPLKKLFWFQMSPWHSLILARSRENSSHSFSQPGLFQVWHIQINSIAALKQSWNPNSQEGTGQDKASTEL